MLEAILEETETTSNKNVCEMCGKKFSCGANVGNCWCFDVELKPQFAAELKQKFERCLCEECLKKQADSRV